MFERTLIITPHCDDETIGCGGLIHKLLKEGKLVYVLIVCQHESSQRIREFNDALRVLASSGGELAILSFAGKYRDGLLDDVTIKRLITDIDSVILNIRPTAVLFPYASHHQDHRVLNEATIAALRPRVEINFIKLKAMYEYPYLGSWGVDVLPTGRMYLPLSKDELNVKVEALKKYESQLIRDSRDILDYTSIVDFARVRGREIGQYAAEAYYPMSVVIGGTDDN